MGGNMTLSLANIATLQLGPSASLDHCDLLLGPSIHYPNKETNEMSVRDMRVVPFEKYYAFNLKDKQRQEVVVTGRTFIVTLLEIDKLNAVPGLSWTPIQYKFGISEK
jgi:hypothetical protein